MEKPKKTTLVSLKICGLTRLSDLQFCLDQGVEYVGFNFAKSSPRCIEPRIAADLWENSTSGRSSGTGVVAVLVDPSLDFVKDLLVTFPKLSVLQFHGSETVEFLKNVRGLSGSRKLWKAIKVKDKQDLEKAANFAGVADSLLLDGPKPGSGQSFDWGYLVGLKQPFALAGGINLDNLQEAIKLGPWLIDISSGAEIAAGIKDPAKIARICRALS